MGVLGVRVGGVNHHVGAHVGIWQGQRKQQSGDSMSFPSGKARV